MHYSMNRSGRSCARKAFTLVELLVVIGIITILIVLALAVAHRVTGSGKTSATKDTLKNLNLAMTALIQTRGSNPDAWVVDPRTTNANGREVLPIIDGSNGDTLKPVNSVAYFILQCSTVPAAQEALKSIDSRFLREYSPDDAGATGPGTQPVLPTAFDAWGNPIRYVHPQFKGLIWANVPNPPPDGYVGTSTILPVPAGKVFGITQIRRNNASTGAGNSVPPDSDGGINPATQPYFYSSGPDGDPSTIDDNIYLVIPRVQKT
jgi:prepilin-type N-terminal cleavage/methylation domain-containing protein